MRYRRLGENNEPVMGQGRQDFLTDKEAVGQAVITRLRLFRGEWWEDIYLGIPMWQSMLGVVGVKKGMLDYIIQDCILQTTGIFNVENLTSIFNVETRAYEFYCAINTVYGPTAITNGQGVIDR
jgi:hypothetical protein